MHFVNVVLITNVCYTLASLPLNTVWRFISSYLAYVYVLGLAGAMFFDHDDSYKVFGLNFACQC